VRSNYVNVVKLAIQQLGHPGKSDGETNDKDNAMLCQLKRGPVGLYAYHSPVSDVV